MSPDSPPRRFTFTPHWLALIGALLVLGGAMAFSRFEAREQVEQRERDRLLAQAGVLQFIVGNSITTANAILKEQAQEWADNMDRQSASRRLQVLDSALAGMRSLMILDGEGVTQASSREELVNRNFSERPYYLYFKERRPTNQLFVSPPFRSILGSIVMILARPVYNKYGEFIGVVSATLDPDYFTPLLKAIRTSPDLRTGIVHGGGLLFLVEPDRSSAALMDLNEPGTVLRRHLDNGKPLDVVKGQLKITGEFGMWASATVQPDDVETSAPIVVMVGRSFSSILVAWRKDALAFGLLYLVIASSSCIAMHIYLKRKRKFDQEMAEATLRLEAKAHFVQAVTDGIPGLIGYWNDSLHCEFANQAYLEWFGKRPDQIIGIAMPDLLGEDLFRLNEPYVRAVLWGEPQTFERTIKKPDGSYGFTLSRYIPDMQDGKVRGFFVLVSDVTQMKQAQEKLEELVQELNTRAVTDVLTGLANRRHFWELAKVEIVRSGRYNFPLYFIMLDVDKFKSINDTYGHAAGDEVLRDLAATLKATLRETDVVGRLGGEEFGILLIQTGEEDAKLIAERLRQAVEESTVAFEDKTIRYTISLGLASARRNETTVDDLVKRADMALYQAKETGRNRVCCADDFDLGETGAQQKP